MLFQNLRNRSNIRNRASYPENAVISPGTEIVRLYGMPQQSLIGLRQTAELLQLTSVITSYSIHYTKLYEVVGSMREVDGFKFCYKICGVCGHAVRFYFPAVESTSEAVKEYRQWKRYMVQ